MEKQLTKASTVRFKDVVHDLHKLGGDLTICLRKPWNAESEVLLVEVDPMSAIPSDVLSSGFEYFLEISIAEELLEISEVKDRTEDGKVGLLVYYACNDAYPSWVYGK